MRVCVSGMLGLFCATRALPYDARRGMSVVVSELFGLVTVHE